MILTSTYTPKFNIIQPSLIYTESLLSFPVLSVPLLTLTFSPTVDLFILPK